MTKRKPRPVRIKVNYTDPKTGRETEIIFFSWEASVVVESQAGDLMMENRPSILLRECTKKVLSIKGELCAAPRGWKRWAP